MENDFVKAVDKDPIHEIASPVIAATDRGEVFASGTAFLINRGLALTAYHVVEDFIHRYEAIRESESTSEVNFHLWLYFAFDQGKTLVPAEVKRIWSGRPLDIAVLAVRFPPEERKRQWKLSRLNLLPPRVGEEVRAFGFADASISGSDDRKKLDSTPRVTTGTVKEVHHELRDTCNMPFPSFRTDARFDASMSGGPVFNVKHEICGVISSTYPPTTDDDRHDSYASTLWPIVGINIEDKLESTAPRFPLMELFQDRSIPSSNLESVTLTNSDTGDPIPEAIYSYKDWDRPR